MKKSYLWFQSLGRQAADRSVGSHFSPLESESCPCFVQGGFFYKIKILAMTTILYAHPYDKSFNHAILEQVTAKLVSSGREFKVIDLYADGFNPAMEAASLRLYGRGDTADPLAAGYLETMLSTDEFIMIFPIWWANIPAIVGGFFDKVMLSGKAYQADEHGELVPAQIHVKRTVLLTTSQGPTERFKPFFTDYFTPLVLHTLGMENVEWYNCPQAAHGPVENRENFLEKVHERI